jgi:site-specific DNA-adenine methylase
MIERKETQFMADAQMKLAALVKEHGEAKVVGWIESRMKQLERQKNPEFRAKQLARAKERRTEDRQEIENLRAELAALSCTL